MVPENERVRGTEEAAFTKRPYVRLGIRTVVWREMTLKIIGLTGRHSDIVKAISLRQWPVLEGDSPLVE